MVDCILRSFLCLYITVIADCILVALYNQLLVLSNIIQFIGDLLYILYPLNW